jgi:lysozyme family protein
MSVLIPKRTLKNAPRAGEVSLKLASIADVGKLKISDAPEIKVPAAVKSGLEDLGAGMTTLTVGISVKQKADAKRAEEQEKQRKAENEEKRRRYDGNLQFVGRGEVADAAARQQTQFDANKTAAAGLGFSETAQAELVRWRDSSDLTDPAAVATYDKTLETLRTQQEAAIPSGVSDTARTDLRASLDQESRIHSEAAARVHLDAIARETGELIDRKTKIAAQQAADDPGFASVIVDDLDIRLNPLVAAFRPEEADALRQTAQSSVITAAIRGPIAREDFAAAKAPLGSSLAERLSPEVRSTLTADLERARDVARRDLRARTADHLRGVEETGAGHPGWSERVARAFDADEAARLRDQDLLARDIHAQSRRFLFEAPDVIDAALETIRPGDGGSVSDLQRQLHDGLVRQRHRMVEKRRTDPAAYAQRAPEIRAAYDAATKDATLTPFAIGKSLALQDYMGIPEEERRVLPNRVTYETVKQLNALDPEKLDSELRGLEQHYGEYWPQVRQEFEGAGLMPDASVLAAVPVEMRSILVQAMTIGRSELTKRIGDPAVKGIARVLAEALGGHATGPIHGPTDAMENAGRLLAALFVDRGASPTQAARTVSTRFSKVFVAARSESRLGVNMASGVSAGGTDDDPIDIVMGQEGGFSNDPVDRGKETNCGLTLRTYRDVLKEQKKIAKDEEVTAADLKNLSREDVYKFFDANFLKRYRIDKLPRALQAIALDKAINHGPGNAFSMIQQVLNLDEFRPDGVKPMEVDGVLGPETRARAAKALELHGDKFIDALIKRRLEFYENIIQKDPTQERFRGGWTNRANSFKPERKTPDAAFTDS